MLLFAAKVSTGMAFRFVALPDALILICTRAEAPLETILHSTVSEIHVFCSKANLGLVLSTSPVALSSVASIFAIVAGVSLL